MDSKVPLYMQSDRYLSLPNSRIVLNPYDFEAADPNTTQAEYSHRFNIPLNIGYCDPYIHNSTGVFWKDAMAIYEYMPQPSSVPTVVWEADFSSAESWNKIAGQHNLNCANGVMTVTVPSKNHPLNIIQTPAFCCNIDQAILSFRLDEIKKGSKVALKISNDNWNSNICVLHTKKSGFYEFPLQVYTNWKGKQEISLQIHVLDGEGDIARFSRLSITEVTSSVSPAKQASFHWSPACLTTQATYPTGSTATIIDYFKNEATVSRTISSSSSNRLIVAGRFAEKQVFTDGKLQLQSDHWYAEIAAPANTTCCFYDTYADFFSQTCGSPTPKPTTTIWAVRLDNTQTHEFLLSINTNQAPTSSNKFMSLEEREAFWDQIFEKIPKIAEEHLSLCSVSSDTLLQVYRNAWYHIISNILPPSPETDYPYGSMSTGKPSLWAYGDRHCSYAASWETFYGLMLYSEIDPNAAWEMFIGLMSLVDSSGKLGGESLPSVKAQTAWRLYKSAPDISLLRKVFEPLERYLSWRLDNLRWIYLDITPNIYQKDIDFVSAALLDIYYFIKICDELSETNKAETWQNISEKLYQSMTEWFFEDKVLPCQTYDSKTHKSRIGISLVTLKALRLPMLKEQEKTKLIDYFAQLADPQKPFWGLQHVKMENMSYLILGLFRNDKAEEAYKLAEATMYNIASTGFFAEEYNFDRATDEILPCGVRPSVFGSSLFIYCLRIVSGEIQL